MLTPYADIPISYYSVGTGVPDGPDMQAIITSNPSVAKRPTDTAEKHSV